MILYQLAVVVFLFIASFVLAYTAGATFGRGLLAVCTACFVGFLTNAMIFQ